MLATSWKSAAKGLIRKSQNRTVKDLCKSIKVWQGSWWTSKNSLTNRGFRTKSHTVASFEPTERRFSLLPRMDWRRRNSNKTTKFVNLPFYHYCLVLCLAVITPKRTISSIHLMFCFNRIEILRVMFVLNLFELFSPKISMELCRLYDVLDDFYTLINFFVNW